MRIAFLTFEFPDARPGGVGTYVYRCARSLLAAGHEPHIFTLTLPADVRAAVQAGIVVHEVADIAEQIAAGTLPAPLGVAALNGGIALYKLAVGTMLTNALREEHQRNPFDIAEAAEYESLCLPLILRPIDRLPVVTQIHLGTAVNRWANDLPDVPTDRLAEGCELASILGADGVCAATRSVVEATCQLTPFKRDVEIIPYPVETTSEPTPAPVDGPLLFVGRLQKRKGCDVLASAASLFLLKHPRAILRVAGTDTPTALGGGSMQAAMIRRLDHRVLSRVIFLGELSQEQVQAEVRACRFQIVPSTVENFASTATDALAAGRAVVYGGRTGLDDVVGNAGLAVWPLTPENLCWQMETMYSDNELLANCGRRRRERITGQFSFGENAKHRVAFYRSVIATASRSDRPAAYDRLGGLNSQQMASILGALTTILHHCAGAASSISTPGRRTAEILEKLSASLERPPVVWLFGAGRHTIRMLAERFIWESRGMKVAGIIDDHPRFAVQDKYLGLPIRLRSDMETAIEHGEKIDAIILSTDTLEQLFWERTEYFRKKGIQTILLYRTQPE